MKLTTYRFQHVGLNSGPYQLVNNDEDCKWVESHSVSSALCVDHDDEIIHPSVFEDCGEGLANIWGTWECACPSMTYLMEWFDGYIDELFDSFFEIVEVTVDVGDFYIGDSGLQGIYDTDYVKKRVIAKNSEEMWKFLENYLEL